ncbi:MAG: hypothetical protein J6Y42_03815, partial [Bacilli bacterium]|nr:hypothetical protein [Bacilli bacterium]
MGPKTRFNTQSAKDYMLKYGYTVSDKFHYTNMLDKIRMYDVINEKYVNQSMKTLIYHTEQATNKRPEFDTEGLQRIMNIDYQPGRIQLDSETRKEMFDIINDVQTQPGRVRDEDRFLNNNEATLQYINTRIDKNEQEQLKAAIKKQLPNTVKAFKKAIDTNGIIVLDAPDSDDVLATEAFEQAFQLSTQILKKHYLGKKNISIILTS